MDEKKRQRFFFLQKNVQRVGRWSRQLRDVSVRCDAVAGLGTDGHEATCEMSRGDFLGQPEFI